MKNYNIIVLLLLLSSCISTNQVFFSDPNYLTSEEFSTVETIEDAYSSESDELIDTSNTSENEYLSDSYYDFSYSSRIRRFHSPTFHSMGFYSGIYTDYYWYNQDPFYYGSSIYSGYGWNSPYYSYSPFWNNSYYNYYGYYGYNSYNGYNGYNGHHNHHGHYNDYHSNNNFNSNLNNNSNYSYGPRGSLKTNSGSKLVKGNTSLNKSFQNTKSNIRNKQTTKSSNDVIKNFYKNQKKYTQKNNNSKNNKSSENVKTYDSNKRNSTFKKNTRSNNSYKSNNRSNSSRPSRSNPGRTKPRK